MAHQLKSNQRTLSKSSQRNTKELKSYKRLSHPPAFLKCGSSSSLMLTIIHGLCITMLAAGWSSRAREQAVETPSITAVTTAESAAQSMQSTAPGNVDPAKLSYKHFLWWTLTCQIAGKKITQSMTEPLSPQGLLAQRQTTKTSNSKMD